MPNINARYVTGWSGITFDRPVPLIRRRDVHVGDLVQSSHGYRGVISEATTRGSGPGTTSLTIELHRAGSGVFRTEHYPGDSTIPVLAFRDPGDDPANAWPLPPLPPRIRAEW